MWMVLNTGGAGYDMQSFLIQASTVLHHQNVYPTGRYPYPPVWIFIAALCLWVSNVGHLAFVDVVRIPGSLADIGISVALMGYGVSLSGPRWRAVLPGILYALNPLPLLITAGHGQFDALPILAILACLMLLRRRPVLASLTLGVAIALKGYPVLLLPYVVLSGGSSDWWRRLVAALVPTVIAVAAYTAWVGWSSVMIQDILSNQGGPPFGWSAFVPHGLGVAGPSLSRVAEGALLIISALLGLHRPAWSPAAAVAFIFLSFYAGGVTISVQYLLWGLPFFLLLDWPLGVAFSLTASLGALVFYAQYFPKVLPFAVPGGPPSTTLVYFTACLPTLAGLGGVAYFVGRHLQRHEGAGALLVKPNRTLEAGSAA